MSPLDKIEQVDGLHEFGITNLIPRSDFNSMLEAPANMIALIQIKKNGNLIGRGSGALVGSNIILTAKHIFKGSDSCVLALGYDTKKNRSQSEEIVSIKHHPDPKVDLSVILIHDIKGSWFEFASVANPIHEVSIAGYGYTYKNGGMHCSSGSTILEDISGIDLRYTINTKPGDSGAPIYLEEQEGFKIVGVHLSSGKDFMVGNKGIFIDQNISFEIRKMVTSLRAGQ